MKYSEAPDVQGQVAEIVQYLELTHILPQFVYCYRSNGSKSKRIIARIYGLAKIWQLTLGLSPTYIIEVISERFDKLSEKEKEKTVIHELLHIPKGFSGGFRPHKGFVEEKTVENLYQMLLRKRESVKS